MLHRIYKFLYSVLSSPSKDKTHSIQHNTHRVIPTASKKVAGEIGYFELSEWWLSAFSAQERVHIEQIFQPYGTTSDSFSLTQGHIESTSQTATGLLTGLAGWFNNAEDREIAKKIIDKATELGKCSKDILDFHFALSERITIYYRDRETDATALDEAIKACRQQIEIAESAAKQFIREYPSSPLPTHNGYTQLAIILKKQGQHQELIEICTKAKQERWNGDWRKRITEAQKKMKQ